MSWRSRQLLKMVSLPERSAKLGESMYVIIDV
jgi:hypothetical protein